MPLRERLRPEEFLRFGYTVRCPGCEQIQLQSSDRRNHTEQCRLRMDPELAKTDEGKDRLGKAKDRLDARTTEIGQAGVVEENAEVVQPDGMTSLRHRGGAKWGMEKRAKMTLQIFSVTLVRIWRKINRYPRPQEGKRGKLRAKKRPRQAPEAPQCLTLQRYSLRRDWRRWREVWFGGWIGV